jgi:hypothetical protein
MDGRDGVIVATVVRPRCSGYDSTLDLKGKMRKRDFSRSRACSRNLLSRTTFSPQVFSSKEIIMVTAAAARSSTSSTIQGGGGAGATNNNNISKLPPAANAQEEGGKYYIQDKIENCAANLHVGFSSFIHMV